MFWSPLLTLNWDIVLVITSALRGGYVIVGVCPSVSFFVNSVTQKLIDGFYFKLSHIAYLLLK